MPVREPPARSGGWDLLASGSTADASFHDEVLRGTCLADDAGTESLQPAPGGLFDGLGELSFYDPPLLFVGYPDVLAPVPGGAAELTYLGGTGGTAAVSWDDGASRVVCCGFPVEVIDTESDRPALLERVLRFFELL